MLTWGGLTTENVDRPCHDGLILLVFMESFYLLWAVLEVDWLTGIDFLGNIRQNLCRWFFLGGAGWHIEL
jgi:hypothetical protein